MYAIFLDLLKVNIRYITLEDKMNVRLRNALLKLQYTLPVIHKTLCAKEYICSLKGICPYNLLSLASIRTQRLCPRRCQAPPTFPKQT
jgi:hypothetical protein